jgi:hypothetical protein
MPLLDIELVKSHLRVDDTDSDTLIEAYQGAAEEAIERYLDREIYIEGTSPTTVDGVALNAAITAAILLLIGDLYADRETEDSDFQRRAAPGQDAVFPRQVRSLLAPYRVWRIVSESASYYGYDCF